jgi:gluconolactonase
MVVDCAGNLYVAFYGGVAVIDPGGQELGRIALASEQVTNVAFGGPSRRTLFITHLGYVPGLQKVELGLPGLPY